ncbi:Glu/Leu/Phe/Val dehydrogenase [Pelagibius sp. CAU 1746]|uniref:Glu/Leu/Phe/Val family dehydrogenase n=1 Tax=Pelagibius sp. CAU 1746 TaxID=3140370 RepID=UPI00325C1755
MEDAFRFCDNLGPAKVIHIYETHSGLNAILVVDNVARGPAIGGVRMAPDVSTEECFRLARAMTFKNAAADLRHGGGKAVIVGDPRMPPEGKARLIRAFAAAIAEVSDYIPGPDMGTDETCMAWIHDEIGRCVGLPSVLGGIPLDEIGATGFGLSIAVDVARGFCDLDLQGARVAVQGFGSVGRHAARFLAEKGAVLVAAADSKVTLADPAGLDIEALAALKDSGRNLGDHPAGEKLDRDAVVGVDCDIWIPAARPDVIREDNVDQVKAKLVVEGANIPVTAEAEAALHDRGVLVIPDFIANAGGVICGAVEFAGGGERQAFDAIEEKVRRNTRAVLEASRDDRVAPRAAAVTLARQRVEAATALRRWA